MPNDEEGKEFEVDSGVGKLKFEGLFKGIGNLIDLASKLGEEAQEIKSVGEIKGLPKDAKGVYGFSIRTLAGGKPVVETFGNIKDTPKGPVVEEAREPMVDVFDEQDHSWFLWSFPGFRRRTLSLR